MVDCKQCINSGCCKLAISIDKEEYENLDSKVKNEFIKRIDLFLLKSPQFKGVIEKDLEISYKDNYAIMKKSEDGYCNLLDKETMLCTVYEKRPKICQTYNTNRCSKIRLLKYEN